MRGAAPLRPLSRPRGRCALTLLLFASSSMAWHPARPMLLQTAAPLTACRWRVAAVPRAMNHRGPSPGDDKEDGSEPNVRRRMRAFASSFLPALALFLWVRSYVVEPFYIPSLSMYPTLTVNDQIAVEKFSKLVGNGPRRGDLVVFTPPRAYYDMKQQQQPSQPQTQQPLPSFQPQQSKPSGPMQRTTLVKRVVGVAGDSIEVRDGVLLRNGQRTYEPYVREATRYTLPPTTVPAGCIYVLGDNRNVSDDSHVWGPLAVEQVVGKAFYILWPISRQGFVDEFMQDLEVTGNPALFMERVGEELGRSRMRPR